MIKLVSWNVNSVRVRLPHLIELNKTVKPDIIMLQETKSTDENFPFDDIKNLISGSLKPDLKENITGNVEIREIFSISKIGKIAGCFVKEGNISRN